MSRFSYFLENHTWGANLLYNKEQEIRHIFHVVLRQCGKQVGDIRGQGQLRAEKNTFFSSKKIIQLPYFRSHSLNKRLLISIELKIISYHVFLIETQYIYKWKKFNKMFIFPNFFTASTCATNFQFTLDNVATFFPGFFLQ